MTDQFPPMTSHRPYLLRALYEWIADNGMTPHLLVDATRSGVQVPLHAVKDGRIVLNVAERAVARLEMTNELIRFSARFGGVSHAVSVPVSAVLAIYARETGQGMALPDDMLAGEADSDADLEEGATEDAALSTPASGARPTLSAVPDAASSDGDDDGGDDPAGPDSPRPRPGGPFLRVVK
jgi:stringent starvation protein B